jgi:hypothetical protein
MEFFPGVIIKTVKYIICASRKQASPKMNIFPLFFENSSTTSPAQEKRSPAKINLCDRLLRGFRFTENRIIRTGIISALDIKPGKKTG